MSDLSKNKLGPREYIGYALGDMGGTLTFALISSFLQLFYTDVLHIDLAKITILMLVARLWDAVNDPLWGSFIDSRKATKHGRFRPYILGAAFPLALASILLFAKIPLFENHYIIYAYVTYIFYGMMYTGTNVPYGSLAAALTDHEQSRSTLSMWRSIGAGLGGLPAQMILPLVVYDTVFDAVANKDIKVINSDKLFFAVLILSILSVLIYYISFKNTKERIIISPAQNENKYNLRRSMTALLKNKPFIVLCAVSMLLICFQMYTQTTYNYLFKNYYNKPELFIMVTVCTYLPMAFFFPVMNKLINRFGKKEICSAGLVLTFVANLILFAIGFTPLKEIPWVFLGLMLFSGAGQTFLVLEVWALVIDVTDYHELLTGRREEGTTYSLYNFVRKIGMTLAGAGSAALLGVIGYDTSEGVISQPQVVLDKLYTISTLVPAILVLGMFLMLHFGYRFNKKNLAEMRKELEAKRTENAE